VSSVRIEGTNKQVSLAQLLESVCVAVGKMSVDQLTTHIALTGLVLEVSA